MHIRPRRQQQPHHLFIARCSCQVQGERPRGQVLHVARQEARVVGQDLLHLGGGPAGGGCAQQVQQDLLAA
jgi:hypothetical protein